VEPGVHDREVREPNKLWKQLREFDTYIGNNQEYIPNYGERNRNGERIATSFVESTVNQLVSKWMVKRQQNVSGSAIPGAIVKATQTETGVARTTISDMDGAYVLSNLAIGPYRLEIDKPGFSTYVQTGIVLQVQNQSTVDVSLKVGDVNEQIKVEANAALVETQSANVGSVIENRRILELPLNGRLATDLIQPFPRASQVGAVSPTPVRL
jgi:hypothetical protein